MSYVPKLETRAQRSIEALNSVDPALAEDVLDALERLAADPVQLSRTVEYPRAFGQSFLFDGSGPRERFHFIVVFQYHELTNAIHILAIDYVER